MMGSVSTIESLGLVDGPGIRCVVFLNFCKLRCLYCHNPETWEMGLLNYTPSQLVEKIKRYKPYFGENGGVTFSGGEPLLQPKFLIECCKLLKEEGIHIALDTAGVGTSFDKDILSLVDLVIFDIKHIESKDYKYLTGYNINESINFIKLLNESKKDVWLRQVIIPNFNDTHEYILEFSLFIRQIKNVKKVEFIPYHKLGSEKYEKLGIENHFKDVLPMNSKEVQKLYEYFLKIR